MNKYKLINDPVHGFITIPNTVTFQLLETIYFQRLRRISQMAMASYVYPGATHTRFHHALGAMFLMQKALDTLKKKQVSISPEEEQATLNAILLHDIGHGPYSHALEYVMTEGINHEFFSRLIMEKLNTLFGGALDLSLQIFNNNYEKAFLHQLVSSQLDVDRLDYLARDSFYSGVTEGKISNERIISMLNILNGQLVVEEKGRYSIEKYIISRHLMYWQVYLHKTVIAAEQLLVKAIQRAKYLALNKDLTATSPYLNQFLKNNYVKQDFINEQQLLNDYCQLDDYDIMFSIKEWQNHPDKILATLCQNIVNRRLPACQLSSKGIDNHFIAEKKQQVKKQFQCTDEEVNYFVFTGSVQNQAYMPGKNGIFIVDKKDNLKDISQVSHQIIDKSLSQPIIKEFICYPKQEN